MIASRPEAGAPSSSTGTAPSSRTRAICTTRPRSASFRERRRPSSDLNESGLLAIVVTNQSGIARGLLSEAEYRRGERRLDQLLEREGARLDAHYFCPHLPEISGPCDCRKPGVLLYQQAAERFGIDLRSSWWVGDRERDVAPAAAFNGKGILVLTGAGKVEAAAVSARGFEQVRDLAAAVEVIVSWS